MLSEVYFIPSLCNNIISLGQLTEQGSKIMLEGEFLWVYDRNKTLLMKVKWSVKRLYKSLLHTCDPISLLTSLEDPAWLWNARLGHVNFHALKFMFEKRLVSGLPRIDHPTQLCEGCLVAKHARSPFPAIANFR